MVAQNPLPVTSDNDGWLTSVGTGRCVSQHAVRCPVLRTPGVGATPGGLPFSLRYPPLSTATGIPLLAADR